MVNLSGTRDEETFAIMYPTLTIEERYMRLTHLLSEMPELMTPGPVTTEMQKWLGKAVAVVDDGDKVAGGELEAIVKLFPPDLLLRKHSVQQVVSILHIALAKAELVVPAALTGSFIAAGSSYDAYAAVAKVLKSAKADLVLIDPYASETVLNYALAAPENVSIRVLSDSATVKPSLKPAAVAWATQHVARPLQARLAAPKTLHDRLILVDGSTAWSLGQSFNKLAERAHTSISQLEPEIAKMKLAAYTAMWNAAVPL